MLSEHIVTQPPQMPFGIASGKRFNKAAQAIAATHRLRGAIERHCFDDVMPNWTELLLVCVEQSPSPLKIETTDWHQMVTAIDKALHGSDSPEAFLLWAAADEHVRAFARQRAASWTATARKDQGQDHWEDVEPTRRDAILHAHSQAAKFTAFAKEVA